MKLPRDAYGKVRGRVEVGSTRARAWVDRRRGEAVPMDLAVSFYERDRELFASVLGAAVALRLFLFIVPTVLLGAAALTALLGQERFQSVLQESSVTGQLADEVNTATDLSTSAWVVLIITSLWLTVWAGRNLAIVLAVCSGAAWRLEARSRRVTLRAIGTVTALVFALVLVASVTNRLRHEFGLAGATSSWLVSMVAFFVAWFGVMWALPRGTPDPGAILPGAALVGLALAVMQWFMQFYLPDKLERASAVAGGTGATVAVLGAMFLIGRVMASSFILNAVVYERLGSISATVFSLPLIRQLPRRFPGLAQFFDLPHDGEHDDDR